MVFIPGGGGMTPIYIPLIINTGGGGGGGPIFPEGKGKLSRAFTYAAKGLYGIGTLGMVGGVLGTCTGIGISIATDFNSPWADLCMNGSLGALAVAVNAFVDGALCTAVAWHAEPRTEEQQKKHEEHRAIQPLVSKISGAMRTGLLYTSGLITAPALASGSFGMAYDMISNFNGKADPFLHYSGIGLATAFGTAALGIVLHGVSRWTDVKPPKEKPDRTPAANKGGPRP